MASESENSRRDDGGHRSSRTRVQRITRFLEHDIWEHVVGEDKSLRDQGVALLRVLSISWKGLFENSLFSRAASLSYSSLLALGPLIAVTVLFSSSLVQTDPEVQIKKAILFVAPSLQEMVTIPGQEQSIRQDEEMVTAIDTMIEQIIEGAQNLISRVNTGGSKAFGALGGLILIWVVIQLLTSIETTLNQIWGVHQGRSWIQRIVFYWTFISLGALLGLGSTAMFSASNLVGMFDWFPLGSEMSRLLIAYSPFVSFFMLVLLLVLFYRFFPNTSVALKPALIGSFVTASLLFLNNYLSILYVHRVISIQSFYGSMGIIPVMMIGLFFFWVLILLGGQLTYSVQNVSFLANQAVWQRISPKERELVTLSAFLTIARRFQSCEDAPTMTDLSVLLHVPVNVLNQSLELLESIGWIIRVSVEGDRDDKEQNGFRPAKPLENFNLSRFKAAVEDYGQSGMASHLIRQNSLLGEYVEHITAHEKDPFCQKNLKELIGN